MQLVPRQAWHCFEMLRFCVSVQPPEALDFVSNHHPRNEEEDSRERPCTQWHFRLRLSRGSSNRSLAMKNLSNLRKLPHVFFLVPRKGFDARQNFAHFAHGDLKNVITMQERVMRSCVSSCVWPQQRHHLQSLATAGQFFHSHISY